MSLERTVLNISTACQKSTSKSSKGWFTCRYPLSHVLKSKFHMLVLNVIFWPCGHCPRLIYLSHYNQVVHHRETYKMGKICYWGKNFIFFWSFVGFLMTSHFFSQGIWQCPKFYLILGSLILMAMLIDTYTADRGDRRDVLVCSMYIPNDLEISRESSTSEISRKFLRSEGMYNPIHPDSRQCMAILSSFIPP